MRGAGSDKTGSNRIRLHVFHHNEIAKKLLYGPGIQGFKRRYVQNNIESKNYSITSSILFFAFGILRSPGDWYSRINEHNQELCLHRGDPEQGGRVRISICEASKLCCVTVAAQWADFMFKFWFCVSLSQNPDGSIRQVKPIRFKNCIFKNILYPRFWFLKIRRLVMPKIWDFTSKMSELTGGVLAGQVRACERQSGPLETPWSGCVG